MPVSLPYAPPVSAGTSKGQVLLLIGAIAMILFGLYWGWFSRPTWAGFLSGYDPVDSLVLLWLFWPLVALSLGICSCIGLAKRPLRTVSIVLGGIAALPMAILLAHLLHTFWLDGRYEPDSFLVLLVAGLAACVFIIVGAIQMNKSSRKGISR
ncbi:MAG: hypothetical protein LBB35_02220 [Coriobacteriaceae bacterium]|jgi:hypothetical protein|nr:hypothetical protein [Coriobacteriaceae bacterium]